jgi:CO/xanthine dehydrogenase Mo-binding subunit
LARQNRQGIEGLDEDIVERIEDNLAKRGFIASDAQFIAMVKSAMKTEAEEKRKKKQQQEEDDRHVDYIMSLGRK